ncbi:uncharacterized protein LOC113213714 isoform X2 [Frankliniella occidentalis]|uniref:Tyrosine-protein kinase receptor n=1 Tax=Frankliniella occidentalis TaxID=133901 RepID=A0A9C6U504_FRAOC|nr:uncharacterized protein LOC113213714 isoform X2 [Frankliniella occidentalis]
MTIDALLALLMPLALVLALNDNDTQPTGEPAHHLQQQTDVPIEVGFNPVKNATAFNLKFRDVVERDEDWSWGEQDKEDGNKTTCIVVSWGVRKDGLLLVRCGRNEGDYRMGKSTQKGNRTKRDSSARWIGYKYDLKLVPAANKTENLFCGSFQCDSGECLRRDDVCDTVEDCSDGSDEKNCKDPTQLSGAQAAQLLKFGSVVYPKRNKTASSNIGDEGGAASTASSNTGAVTDDEDDAASTASSITGAVTDGEGDAASNTTDANTVDEGNQEGNESNPEISNNRNIRDVGYDEDVEGDLASNTTDYYFWDGGGDSRGIRAARDVDLTGNKTSSETDDDMGTASNNTGANTVEEGNEEDNLTGIVVSKGVLRDGIVLVLLSNKSIAQYRMDNWTHGQHDLGVISIEGPKPESLDCSPYKTCNNEVCMRQSDACNKFDDCGDNSDEASCDYEKKSKDGSKLEPGWEKEIAAGASFVVILVALAVVWYLRRRRLLRWPSTPSLIRNPMYDPTDVTSKSSQRDVAIIDKNDITFDQEGNLLGSGNFGMVFKAQLTKPNCTPLTVALKKLKERATNADEEDFKREVDIMTSFDDPNIVQLVGVVHKDPETTPPTVLYIVFEYMLYGDLQKVLRSSKQGPIPGLPPLTGGTLVSVALQVARGMRYLAERRFVHRDLAARNCLVGENLTVKIADFGMSRDIYMEDYYRIRTHGQIPVRWMAPETLHDYCYTLMSDVWSYGVLLWEVFTAGQTPYYQYNNQQVIGLIQNHILLPVSECTDCPQKVIDVMRGCWKKKPETRLRFTKICARLENAYKDFFVSVDNEYYQQELSGDVPRRGDIPGTSCCANSCRKIL